jgi:NitT/TauT family transport system substrate-binding protein
MYIGVPDFTSNTMFPVLAAKELRQFEAEGLHVEVQLHTGFRALQALHDGVVDFYASTAEEPLALFPNWKGAKLLAALAQGTPYVLVMRSDLAVRRNDLRGVVGRRIGAAPAPGRVLKHLLRQAGIDLQNERVEIVSIPGTSDPGVSTGVTAARALANGQLDGFWANALGAEVAVHLGVGDVILDCRRGDGPPGAADYTFAALATTASIIERDPRLVEAVIRAVVRAQVALRDDPSRATQIGERLFPALEAQLIGEVVQRDAQFYVASISEESVEQLNRFAQASGLLPEPVPYASVVATEFSDAWNG